MSNWREKYDQIECLECAICMDEMADGEIVVKTFCGQNIFNNKDKLKQSSNKALPDPSPLKSENESRLEVNLLKGHIFHK